MSGAGEPRTSIFSEPPCDSDKGDSRPQADNHVGENFGGVCVEPLVLPVLQTLPSFYSRCIEGLLFLPTRFGGTLTLHLGTWER